MRAIDALRQYECDARLGKSTAYVDYLDRLGYTTDEKVAILSGVGRAVTTPR